MLITNNLILKAAFSLCLYAVIVLAPRRAEGDDAPLYSNDFLIDTYTGPQIASIRVTTMGGAYAGIAERAQGIIYNPAAVAQRVWYSKYLFDYDAGYAYLKPGLVVGEDMDFDNDGDRSFSYHNFFAGVLYGALRAGRVGGGSVASLQRYTLEGKDGNRMAVRLGHVDLAIGYNFLEDFLVAGAGLRMAFMNISVRGVEHRNALSYLLNGLMGGILLRLKHIPFRVGLGASFPLRKSQREWTRGVMECPAPGGEGFVKKVGTSGDCGGDGLIIPRGIAFPWTMRLGFAYYLGKLDWNEKWEMDKRIYEYSNRVPLKGGDYGWSPWRSQYMIERGEADRRYVLFALDIEFVRGVKEGIGLEGFLDQKLKASGDTPTVSVHGGVESEVWADRLVLRGGGYAEPSRFRRRSYRGHGTFGFDLRLFSFCSGSSRISFRGSAGVDAARGYLNAGFSIGFWN